jgi:hypothetical protein
MFQNSAHRFLTSAPVYVFKGPNFCLNALRALFCMLLMTARVLVSLVSLVSFVSFVRLVSFVGVFLRFVSCHSPFSLEPK